TAAAAAEALTRLGPRAVAPLAERLPRAAPEEAALIVAVLGALADPAATPALRLELGQKPVAPPATLEALALIAVRGDDGARAALKAVLNERDVELRREAVRVLARTDAAFVQTQLVEPMKAALGDGNADIRRLAARALFAPSSA